MENKKLIPKIIHMTWFSGDELPKKLKRCIETWKKNLPDFEIKVWDMEMARALNIAFVNEALDARKWAFASDVVRAYAVWKYGGVYMDTDIFLRKRFDSLLEKELVFFMERNEKEWKYYNPAGSVDATGHCVNKERFIRGRQIQAAFFMGKAGHPCLREIIDIYRNRHFLNENGIPDMSVISPSVFAKALEKYGFLYTDKKQILNDILVLPSSYVSTSKYEAKKNTIAIHLCEHAWDPRSPWMYIKFKIITSPIGCIINKIRYSFCLI